MKKDNIKLTRKYFDYLFFSLTFLGLIMVGLLAIFQLSTAVILFSIAIGSFLYLGFGLPRWIGRKRRDKRAMAAKRGELSKWGFYSQDREGPWQFAVNYPVFVETRCAKGKFFYSEWLVIHDGIIIVNPGRSSVNLSRKQVTIDYVQRKTYAWDGCSPKRLFFWLFMLGPYDGNSRQETIQVVASTGDHKIQKAKILWPSAIHASLIHDALYQYLNSIPIAKADVDLLFKEMLLKSEVEPWVANAYYLATRFFGSSTVSERKPQANSKFMINLVPGYKTLAKNKPAARPPTQQKPPVTLIPK